ncbi:MAG: serine--tRNA ligase [Acidobacteria bacterium]|nr:MAG: serine--tRNA ligase [Acidobacteriota bacterium]
MLDPALIRERTDDVRRAMESRGEDPVLLDRFLEADTRRRSLLQGAETLKQERNKANEEIAQAHREKRDASERIQELKRLSEQIKGLDGQIREAEESSRSVLLEIPNLPHASVPAGTSADDNPVLRTHGSPPQFDFEPQDHVTLGENLGILDLARAARMSGARFAVALGDGARLERELIQFMLEVHTGEHGYLEVLPPFLVNSDAMTGTGQLPKFEEDLFRIQGEDLYLIPTAEVPVTNLYREEILEPGSLPMKFVSYTPCFRAEAGSHGQDTRGLIRQHQFNKVELVQYAEPEQSYEALDSLTAHAETILQRLELPYRVVDLCTADLGFSAARTFDLEVWLPSQNTYREISSCSNFEAYQARRARIRYRPEKGAKSRYLHTINGSALAIGRTLVAILENYQQADGTVRIPRALVPFMGGKELIEPRT